MKNIILVDIDNCFSDSRLWIEELPRFKPQNTWDYFFSKVDLCHPNKSFIDNMNNSIYNYDLYPIFITARPNRIIDATRNQISEFSDNMYSVNRNCMLYMRNDNDLRDSWIVKKELLNNILNIIDRRQITYSIDDSIENCNMFSNMGIRSYLYDINTNNYKTVESM